MWSVEEEVESSMERQSEGTGKCTYGRYEKRAGEGREL